MRVGVPAEAKVNWQLPVPAANAVPQLCPVLAVTVTFPVGVPLAWGATVKATVTACCATEGFGERDVIVVAEVALPTVTVPGT